MPGILGLGHSRGHEASIQDHTGPDVEGAMYEGSHPGSPKARQNLETCHRFQSKVATDSD